MIKLPYSWATLEPYSRGRKSHQEDPSLVEQALENQRLELEGKSVPECTPSYKDAFGTHLCRASLGNCHGIPNLGGLEHHHLSDLAGEWLLLCTCPTTLSYTPPPHKESLHHRKGLLAWPPGC